MGGTRLSIGMGVGLAALAAILLTQSAWAQEEKLLYSFKNNLMGGSFPSSVISDTVGNLYGTTVQGGTGCQGYGCGTVFELTPKAGGGWTEKVLHKFNDNGGAFPFAGLIFDTDGNLYGTTYDG